MNCRCLSGCHPVISKQFSPSPTATTHSPCGRFSHFSLIWHWIWFWICTSINSASPTGSYWGKRSCIWTLACTTQARWFLERKVPWQMFHSQETPFDFNVLLHSYFKCPDVRRCQVSPQQQKVNPRKRKNNKWHVNLTDMPQVTGLNGVNFLDRTRTPLEGPHPGLPPQVSSIQSQRFGEYFIVFKDSKVINQINLESDIQKQIHNVLKFDVSAAGLPGVQRSCHTVWMDGQVAQYFNWSIWIKWNIQLGVS